MGRRCAPKWLGLAHCCLAAPGRSQWQYAACTLPLDWPGRWWHQLLGADPDPAVLHGAGLPACRAVDDDGFTRIAIVLSLMRQALGTQSAPPNQVIIGLSLFHLLRDEPDAGQGLRRGLAALQRRHHPVRRRLQRGEVPMRGWMLKQTRQSDVALFARLAKLDAKVKPEDVPFRCWCRPSSRASSRARSRSPS